MDGLFLFEYVISISLCDPSYWNIIFKTLSEDYDVIIETGKYLLGIDLNTFRETALHLLRYQTFYFTY